MQTQAKPMRARIRWLVALPLAMFGFGYLMVPIYNVFCDLTGLNGKTGEITAYEAAQLAKDESRLIEVQFIATANQNAAWQFAPKQSRMQVHPGRAYHAAYTAQNERAQTAVAQAVPSVAPGKAANYFNKTECFCFNQQTFAANERRDMPLTFIIDPDIPAHISSVTLSYTLFDLNQIN